MARLSKIESEVLAKSVVHFSKISLPTIRPRRSAILALKINTLRTKGSNRTPTRQKKRNCAKTTQYCLLIVTVAVDNVYYHNFTQSLSTHRSKLSRSPQKSETSCIRVMWGTIGAKKFVF
jgi:hypothetical protein